MSNIKYDVDQEKESFDYERVKNDDFSSGYMTRLTKDLKSKTNDFYSAFLSHFEDLLTYVEQLENQVKELNFRLATNTPEDVQLLLDVFNEKLIQEKSSYVSNLMQTQNDIETIKRNLHQAHITATDSLKTCNNIESIFSNKIREIEESIFYNSLPIKIVEDTSIMDKDGIIRAFYTFLDNNGNWDEMSKEKFESILPHYVKIPIIEPNIVCFGKIHKSKNALFFSHI